MVNADLVLPGGLYAYDPATGTSTRLISAYLSAARYGLVKGALILARSHRSTDPLDVVERYFAAGVPSAPAIASRS